MVRFIRQEAEEKANEISVSANEEFNIEKLQLVEAEKKKIRQEYEREEKQVEVRRKIEYSMQLNASGIKVLQAQDDVVNSIKDAAAKELLCVSHDQHVYRNLQSLRRLKEPAVLLRCQKGDLDSVEHVLDSAKEEYAVKASLWRCSLASRDGKIVFENTLDARLDVVFRKKLPEVWSIVTIDFVIYDALSHSHLQSESQQESPEVGDWSSVVSDVGGGADQIEPEMGRDEGCLQ
ncbi:hypothetical protein RHGRI_005965 [Rhododendron griersonianum]|uniref:Uncharacterized protein n=1 Tax=Rhododendron griersonianum TaxID=479676 RepID=A0AAV6LF31_9ERIC|nr:hypothetical protein RHGRI_005965 [Rhododendron griersonianum]